MIKNVPILIVDDLPQNIMALEAILCDMEVEVITAQSGNEALRQSLRHDFALILLDVQMPDMNGFEVARLIRSHPKTSHFPIIFVTAGMKDLLEQIKGYETGAVDYLMKPFETVILRSKIKVFRELYLQRKAIEEFSLRLEQMVEERTAELKRANETISHIAATDELTGLANRRFFNENLSVMMSAARRHKFPLSLIMVDLDHFKTVNDTHGHSEGDRVLQGFARLLKDVSRTEDIAARWGGEEFIIVLPHTEGNAAVALAERIRTVFAESRHGVSGVTLTASFGVVELQHGEEEDSFIRRADDALYCAKHEGRNRVVMQTTTQTERDRA